MKMVSSCLKDYGRVCFVCGSLSCFTASLYLMCALLMRYYLHGNSIQFFETLPTYVPAITYGVCGLNTLAFVWERHQKYILLKLTSLLALVNATLSCIFSLAIVFVNVKVFMAVNEETCDTGGSLTDCQCKAEPFSPAFPKEETIIFHHANGDCTLPMSVLSFCFVVLVPTSIGSVFLSIFMWRLLDELETYEMD